jgi:hypothetical protein
MVNKEVYKRIRILALERNMEVSAVIEEAMREKLEKDFPQYKPLPPMQHQQQVASSQPSESQQQTMGASGKPGKPSKSLSQQYQTKIINKIIKLPGIEFPAHKSKIVKDAEESTTPNETDYLGHIESRKYQNELDLENELNRQQSNDKSTIMIFKVINEKIREKQESKVSVK